MGKVEQVSPKKQENKNKHNRKAEAEGGVGAVPDGA
jgi:hypothetical protein